MDHLSDPGAVSWSAVKEELDFTPAEQAEIEAESQKLIAQARAYRLAEVRRRQKATQTDIAKAMGV